MVQARAAEVGNTEAALVAIVCMSLQGIAGYPLTALCLEKKARRLSADYRSGLLKAPVAEDEATGKARAPESTNMILLKLGAICVVSYLLQVLTESLGFQVSLYVWALILGFIAHELHFLSTDCLTKANSYGLCITMIMLYLFGSLSSSDFNTILSTVQVSGSIVLLAAAAFRCEAEVEYDMMTEVLVNDDDALSIVKVAAAQVADDPSVDQGGLRHGRRRD